MLRTIHLHGKLKKLYPNDLKLDAVSIAEIIRALSFQIEGFAETMKEGEYKIALGLGDKAALINEDMLDFNLGKTEDVQIIPALEGEKGKGIGGLILGAALIGLSFAIPGVGLFGGAAGFASATGGIGIGAGIGGAGFFIGSSTLATMGFSLVLGGVSSLLTPQVKSNSGSLGAGVDPNPSFLFQGPQNNVDPGGCAPLVYGRMLVGSTVVSLGFTTEARG